MKFALSLLTAVTLIASMSSCTTYVEERGHSSRGYRSNSNYHASNHRSSSHRSNDRDHRSSTRVRTNVQAPLGISSGVGVNIR